MKTRKHDFTNHNLTPSILIHPDGPALLEAMLKMGINVDRLAAETRIVHPSSEDIVATVPPAVGDIVIDSVHDPPIL